MAGGQLGQPGPQLIDRCVTGQCLEPGTQPIPGCHQMLTPPDRGCALPDYVDNTAFLQRGRQNLLGGNQFGLGLRRRRARRQARGQHTRDFDVGLRADTRRP